MKKIITAIGNNLLNERLVKLNKYQVLGKDIQYKEGILEFLAENSDVNILIVSEILEGEIEFKDLISNILKINSQIEIIVFLEEENRELKNFLHSRGIYKIYQNNQIDMQEFEKILEDENSKDAKLLEEEIKKLKQIIEEQKLQTSNDMKNGNVTAITGNYGVR